MTDEHLRLALPHFVAMFLLAGFYRSACHRTALSEAQKQMPLQLQKVETANRLLSAVLIVFSLVTVAFAYYPQCYRLSLPVDFMNEPVVNSAGFVLLRISFAWVVVAQLFLNRAVHRFVHTQGRFVGAYVTARRNLLAGIALMCVGMAITITSIAALFLCHRAVVAAYKLYSATRK